MKRFSFLTTVFLSAGLWVQAGQSIQPTVLFEAAKGSGPGQYLIDPNSISIRGPLIDDHEDIYILATANNCLQRYDQSGHFMGCISIPSTVPPNAEQRRHGETGPVTSTFAIDIINGTIYALQVIYKGHRHLLKRQGDAFVSADNDTDAADILKHLESHKPNEFLEGGGAFSQLGLTEQEFRSRFPLEKQSRLAIHTDTNKIVWVLSYDGLRVYSADGTLLCRNYAPGMISYRFSKQGNLYAMSYYSHKPMTRQSWSDDYIDGIRLTKFSYQGK